MKLDNEHLQWIVWLLLIALAAFVLFNLTGFRTIVGFALLFVVPVLLLMRHLSLDFEEKVFFSLFIGIGLFPLLVWFVNQLLPSFRLSILAAFVLVVVLGLFLPRILARLKKKPQ